MAGQAAKRRDEEGRELRGLELGVLNDILGFRLRRIQNHLSREFQERVRENDIKPGLFSALALIAGNPGLSQISLSREVGFEKGTVVALVDDLERRGWAERRRSTADRRRHSLYATAAGLAAIDYLRDTAVVTETRIREVLSPEELRQLLALLDKIYVACFADRP
jgi:DNA-binding MarR family transcriptional regulator